jgi:hypothetical protein
VYTGPFGQAEAERLLWRAGFGPRAGEEASLAAKGLRGAVESLVSPHGVDRLVGKPPTVDGHGIAPKDAYGPRYHAVGLQTFAVGGSPPSERGRVLYDVARACLQAGLDAVRPGIEAREVEAPALAALREAGLGDGFKMRFGYGVGVGYPPTWLDPLQITRTSVQQLVPGATFVLHACLLDEPARAGVVVGGTYAVGELGPEMLAGAGAVDLVAV